MKSPKPPIKFSHIEVLKVGDKNIPKKIKPKAPTNFQRTHYFTELRDKLTAGFGVEELLKLTFTPEEKKYYRLTRKGSMRHMQRSISGYVKQMVKRPKDYTIELRTGIAGEHYIFVKYEPVINSMNKGATA